jgi:CelD/BcsL family acetyltransferase involved in cellulose biosynthesis
MITVDVVPLAELGPSEVERWSELQTASRVYRSPFFRPEFAQAVARVRDVRVAVVDEDGAIAGFFPFEPATGGFGRPLAWPRADYHGPVLDARAHIDPELLVKSSGLRAWSFDHLPAALEAFLPYSSSSCTSPYLDLSGGFEAYLDERRPRSEVRETLRKARKLEREIGPLRFVPDDGAARFETLVDWKRRQYAETGVRDVLADAQSRELLTQVLDTRSTAFAGTLSVLYAGEEVAALLLGVRSGAVWHSWFPVFNETLPRYSPGLVLLLELARASESLGIAEIDLGKGEARYKTAFSSDSEDLLEGCVGARAGFALPMRLRSSARRELARIGVHRAMRRALHKLRS